VKQSSNKEVTIGSLSEWDTFFEGCNNDEVNKKEKS